MAECAWGPPGEAVSWQKSHYRRTRPHRSGLLLYANRCGPLRCLRCCGSAEKVVIVQ